MKVLGRMIDVKRNLICWFKIIAGITVILAFVPTAFADLVWDETAEDYTSINTITQNPSLSMSNYTVLWDTSHGVFLDYQPSGRFQPLVQNLASHGFSVDATSQGFLVDDPAGYNVIVVCLGSAWDSPYSSAEVTHITDFVHNGGGLLVMGENTDCPNANIQPIASAFGVSLGLSTIPDDTYTSNLASHKIFEGVTEIYMKAAGEILASSPSSELAWQEATGKALVAAGTYGDGRFVLFGDMNIFGESSFYDLADNRDFSINTFEYLATPEPSTLLLLGLGAVILRKHRKS